MIIGEKLRDTWEELRDHSEHLRDNSWPQPAFSDSDVLLNPQFAGSERVWETSEL